MPPVRLNVPLRGSSKVMGLAPISASTIQVRIGRPKTKARVTLPTGYCRPVCSCCFLAQRRYRNVPTSPITRTATRIEILGP